jgi:hypothetical protein
VVCQAIEVFVEIIKGPIGIFSFTFDVKTVFFSVSLNCIMKDFNINISIHVIPYYKNKT